MYISMDQSLIYHDCLLSQSLKTIDGFVRHAIIFCPEEIIEMASLHCDVTQACFRDFDHEHPRSGMRVVN